MAPPANAAKALQANRPRPTARAIVPAIPLPYIQKRKQQAVVPKKVEEEISPTPIADVQTPSSPVAVDTSPVVANGSAGADGAVIATSPVASETSVLEDEEKKQEKEIAEELEGTSVQAFSEGEP
jgi:hypothetical protein